MKKIWLISLFTAMASSLCCIIPFLAIVAGIFGGATTLDFIAPYRPYFILITAGILGIGFYKVYRPQKQESLKPCCVADAETKSSRNKRFLWTIAIISTLMFFFPYYSSYIISDTQASVSTVESNTLELTIEGMTCQGCANNIEFALSKLDGITKSEVIFEKNRATINYDKLIITENQITKHIENVGYKTKIFN